LGASDKSPKRTARTPEFLRVSSINTTEIPLGETAELKIAARERTGGNFSRDIMIIPQDIEHYKPLKITVTGNVIEPVQAEIGWENKEITKFNPKGPINLGLVHYLSAKPVINIIANSKDFNLSDTVPDVNSVVFKFNNYKFEPISATDNNSENNAPKQKLVLSLAPKIVLKAGSLRDIVRIRLKQNVGIEIPIECLVVRDVYTMERIIHFDNLTESKPKKFTIHFTNNAHVWPDVKWNVAGYLSDAIKITEEQNERTDSSITLTLAVDKFKPDSIPKGYVFCRISFFQKEPTDDEVVTLLVDGFNMKSAL
jgi:hypothetical protein